MVELIVVITILAILWAIAFISLEWYSQSSRDSARLSDMSKIKTSLELFQVVSGKYPDPTEIFSVTYNWTTNAWEQWFFWEQTFRNVERLDKIPLDPLTDKRYAYSVTNTRKEYEIAWVLETTDYALTPINQTNAWEQVWTLKITWQYNWKTLKLTKGWNTLILAVPTLFCSEEITLEQCIEEKKLAFNWYSNLPSNYENSRYNHLWEKWNLNLVNTNDYVLFEWDSIVLSRDDDSWKLARKVFINNMKKAYSGTEIADIEAIKKVVDLVTDETDSNYNESIIESVAIWVVETSINKRSLTTNKIASESSTADTWSCYVNWKNIANWSSIIVYTEENIENTATYDCIDISQEITCNDWVLSDTTILYTSCIKWDIDNCSSSNYTVNNHIYPIPYLNHWENISDLVDANDLPIWSITSYNVKENNWSYSYSLSSLSCDFWYKASWQSCIWDWTVEITSSTTISCPYCSK